MGLFQRLFGRRETRAAGTGYTAAVMAARGEYIAGVAGLGELTATVQSCVTLWENAFALADVDGTDLIDRQTMALIGRALALRGEALFLIDAGGLVAAQDWDLSTLNGRPRAYRLSLSEAGGARAVPAQGVETLQPILTWSTSAASAVTALAPPASDRDRR